MALLLFFVTARPPLQADDAALDPQAHRGSEADPQLLRNSDNPQDELETVRLYYFWGDGCPVCDRQDVFLERLEREHPELRVERFEVWYDEDNLALLREVAEEMGFEPRGVPVTVLGGRHWVGFNPQIGEQIERQLQECFERGCPDPTGSPLPAERRPFDSTEPLHLPLLGEFKVGTQPAVLLTALIAFVDGFNPCSLWVLTMLLALVVYTRSRLKTILVGSTFLLVTAVVYGGFIAGVFGVFAFVQHLGWVRALTAAIAAGFGILNIKDYVRFGQGVSLTISAQHKRGISARIRELVRGERSLPAMVGVTAVMATGIALVELPCTAGFPIIWSGIMVERQISGLGFAALLGLYIAVYLLIELVVFFTAVFGLRAARLTEGYARVLKLFGGVIMLALAFVLVFLPDTMTDVQSSMTVFGLALIVAAGVLLTHRMVRELRS